MLERKSVSETELEGTSDVMTSVGFGGNIFWSFETLLCQTIGETGTVWHLYYRQRSRGKG